MKQKIEKRDFIVESIRQVDMSDLKVPIVVVYDQPVDYPSNFVARVFDSYNPTNVVMLYTDLKKLTEDMYDAGLIFVPPVAEDPECILGSFI